MTPLSLFYSYSHRDEAFRRELETHLSPLRRGKLIAEWHDRMIGAGDEWKAQIDHNLATADIILLLTSSDFIASDYCWGEEMTKALERHERGDARVVPVILRPCRWDSTPLARLQAVPKDAKPVSEWVSRDAAFNDIATAIERAAEELREQRHRAAEQARRQAKEEARQRAEAEASEGEGEAKRKAEEERQQADAESKRKAKEERPPPAGVLEALEVLRDGAWLKVVGFAADLPAGTVFRDAPDASEMVIIPAGSFVMGSQKQSWITRIPGGDEGPQHWVGIARPFAVGRYAVTFGEWDACLAARGCRHTPGDQGWGRGRRPVINVSWDDAKAYVAWLSKKTGKPYRLLSEAEWEYAARAGTTTRYPWGNEPSTNHANFARSGSQWSFKQTAPVGSFEPNAFGLYDMIGNVEEWVKDCWNRSCVARSTRAYWSCLLSRWFFTWPGVDWRT